MSEADWNIDTRDSVTEGQTPPKASIQGKDELAAFSSEWALPMATIGAVYTGVPSIGSSADTFVVTAEGEDKLKREELTFYGTKTLYEHWLGELRESPKSRHLRKRWTLRFGPQPAERAPSRASDPLDFESESRSKLQKERRRQAWAYFEEALALAEPEALSLLVWLNYKGERKLADVVRRFGNSSTSLENVARLFLLGAIKFDAGMLSTTSLGNRILEKFDLVD